MSVLTIPNVLVNGNTPANIVDATGLNQNFTAIATAVNNIYPSQVLPLTAAQATFGATATGVGYKFLANDTTAVPLTISGVTSQTADLLDVTKTSGGTKALAVLAGGQIVGSNGMAIFGGTAVTTGQAGINTDGTIMTFDIFSASGNWAWRNNITGGVATLNQSGTFGVSGSLTAGGSTASVSGDMACARSGSTGAIEFGSTGASIGVFFFDGTKYNFFNAGGGASTANITASTGIYAATSDESLKENVIPLPYGLAELKKLDPVKFDWIPDKSVGLGFRAQEVQKVIPEAVSIVDAKSGILGISDALITPVVVKAVQELAAAFSAYVAAHP